MLYSVLVGIGGADHVVIHIFHIQIETDECTIGSNRSGGSEYSGFPIHLADDLFSSIDHDDVTEDGGRDTLFETLIDILVKLILKKFREVNLKSMLTRFSIVFFISCRQPHIPAMGIDLWNLVALEAGDRGDDSCSLVPSTIDSLDLMLIRGVVDVHHRSREADLYIEIDKEVVVEVTFLVAIIMTDVRGIDIDIHPLHPDKELIMSILCTELVEEWQAGMGVEVGEESMKLLHSRIMLGIFIILNLKAYIFGNLDHHAVGYMHIDVYIFAIDLAYTVSSLNVLEHVDLLSSGLYTALDIEVDQQSLHSHSKEDIVLVVLEEGVLP